MFVLRIESRSVLLAPEARYLEYDHDIELDRDEGFPVRHGAYELVHNVHSDRLDRYL